MMQILGHDGPPTNLWTRNLITNAPLARCPLRSVQLARESHPALSAEIDRAVDLLYPAYRDGHLLVAGGIGDQPHRYIALMGAIRDMKDAVDREFQRIQTHNGEH
jgi:hypothetical protein